MALPALGGFPVELGFAVPEEVGEGEPASSGVPSADMTRSRTWIRPLLVLAAVLVRIRVWEGLREWGLCTYRTLALTTLASLNQMLLSLTVTLIVWLLSVFNSWPSVRKLLYATSGRVWNLLSR